MTAHRSTARWGGGPHLVLITDDQGDTKRLIRIARAAMDSGVRVVQLREEGMPDDDLRQLCRLLLPHAERAGASLMVNHRVAVAQAAHGVHLGRRSVSPAEAREQLGEQAVIGVSAHGDGEVQQAAAQGADYVSLSPVFPTTSKPGAAHLGVSAARAIAEAATIPVVWLGGVDARNVAEVASCSPFAVAVMSAVCSARDPGAASANLLASLRASSATT